MGDIIQNQIAMSRLICNILPTPVYLGRKDSSGVNVYQNKGRNKVGNKVRNNGLSLLSLPGDEY